ncbi:DUF5906 domain-containing protein [Nocardioides cheoyonin]|uniref:DUF5906 domain-containing protein n=1 Tax=Nocardioides cheoyonin TaxID=3156615 RepID=UPI0032B5752D
MTEEMMVFDEDIFAVLRPEEGEEPRPALTLVTDDPDDEPPVDDLEDFEDLDGPHAFIKEARRTADDPIADLASVTQRAVDVSPAAYKSTFEAAGLKPLAEWAVSYLAKRLVAPEVAVRRGYASGTGLLPALPPHLGHWTEPQQRWATTGTLKGREWLLIPWRDASGNQVGAQIRWKEEREEVKEVDKNGNPTAWNHHKFDFPSDRDKSVLDRLVDSLHAQDHSKVPAIIESPVRADSLASLTDALDLAAVGGITMAYEGKSNANNPSDFLPRLSPDVDDALGGIADRHLLWIPDSDHEDNPPSNDATQKTIESGLEYGALSVRVVHVPRTIKHPRSGRVEDLGAGAGLDDYAATAAAFFPGKQWLGELLASAMDGIAYIERWTSHPNDDAGRGARVAIEAARQGLVFLDVGKSGQWWRHNGRHFQMDPGENVGLSIAETCAGRILGTNKSDTKQLRTTARGAAALRNAVSLAKRDARLHRVPDQWEPRVWKHFFPCADGLIDLETGDVAPHTPEAMNLHCSDVHYLPGATHPDWTAFLRDFYTVERRLPNGERVWAYDAAFERMAQEAWGTILMSCNHDTAILAYGAGGVGISTAADLITSVLPDGYKGALNKRAILDGKDGGNQFSFASIRYRRVNIIGETNEGERLDEGKFKILAQDGEPIEIERKGVDPETIRVTGTPYLGTNYLPLVGALAAENDALRRRVVFCRHTRKVDRTAEGPRLERLQSDPRAKEAILAWLVEGAMRLIANGGEVTRTEKSMKDLEAWLNSGDRVGQFLRDTTIRVLPGMEGYGDPDTIITREEMWGLYEEWCNDQHIPEGRRIQSKIALNAKIDVRSEFGDSDNQRDRAGRRGWRNWRRNPKVQPDF